MPDASFVQSSFLGGEWSPYAQGRLDHPKYKTALALCRNSIPLEEGAVERRSGSAFICHMRNGVAGRTLPFNFTDFAPYKVEVTAGKLRVITGRQLVVNTDLQFILSVTTDSPAVFFVAGLLPAAWVTGVQIVFQFNSASDPSQCAILRNRQFAVTVTGANSFTIADPLTGLAVNGTDLTYNLNKVQLQAARIVEFTTPYTLPQLTTLRKVQAANIGPQSLNVLVLLNKGVQPQILEGASNPSAPNLAAFTFTALDFSDGPYLDPPTGAICTPNGLGPNAVQLTITYQQWLSTQAYNLGDFVTNAGLAYQSLTDSNLNNTPASSPTFWTPVSAGGAVGPSGFQQTDVGRAIRLLSEPALWGIGTPYSVGTAVKFNSGYYVCSAANTGLNPQDNISLWQPSTSPTVYTWVWGKIVSVQASNVATVDLVSGPLLYTQAINSFRMGAYSNSTGWPTCGTFHEGRLWLAGAIPNRLDGSVSNDIFNMQPTAYDGTVGDANAITAVFNDDELDEAVWVSQNSQGLSVGTKSGEWLVQASALNDPISPTSIQTHKHTKVGCFNAEPIRTPLTTVFIHKFQRMMFELFPDVFSGKMQSPQLNAFAKHLSSGKLIQLAYQHELAPCVWARTADNKLHGCTYRRKSAFANEEPDFAGFHRHDLGSGRSVIDIAVNPSPDQTTDTLTMVTQDPITGVCHVEEMVSLMDVNDPITNLWLVDDAVTPSGILTSTTGVTLYGLWHLNGKTVSCVIGGLDCGDHAVANGSTFVPFGSDPGGFFTLSYLQGLSGGSYGGLSTSLTQIASSTPAIAGTMGIQWWPLPVDAVTQSPYAYRIDWANAIAYGFCGDGLRAVNIVTGKQLYDANYVTQGINLGQFPGFAQGAGVDPVLSLDGYLYGAIRDGSNSIIIMKVRASDFTLQGTFGAKGSGLQPTLTTQTFGWCYVALFAGAHYMVNVCATSAFSTAIAVLNMDTLTGVTITPTNNPSNIYYGLAEPNAVGCAGPQGALGGAAYFIGAVHGGNLGSTHLYEVSIAPGTILAPTPAVNIKTVRTILPTDIDPTWLTFAGIFGICYDQSDGNLIVGFNSNDATAVNTNYMVKLRPSDGKILWKTPVSFLLNDSLGISQMRTTGGNMVWTTESGTGTQTVFVLNTASGSVSTFTANNFAPGFQDIAMTWDSLTGSLIAYIGANGYSSGGNVAPLTGTPNTFANTFAKITGGGLTPGSSQSSSSGSLPGVVGFTYTSQVQLLRTLLPQEAGMANGPGIGKTTRKHMIGVLLAAAITAAVKFGTLFTDIRTATFKSKGGIPLDTKTLFTGVYQHTLDDNYSFDSQLCWQITRPLPATVCAITGFGHTQDR